MPGKDSLEGREQYRKEQIARWKSDEIKRIIAERDALKERVKVVEISRIILAETIVANGSYGYAIKRASDKDKAFKVFVDNQIYVSELLAKDRIKVTKEKSCES